MRIRIVGLGDIGERVVADASRYFIDRGIEPLLEQRKIVKLTTEQFIYVYEQLAAKLREFLRTPRDHVMLKAAISYVFFGGRDAPKAIDARLSTVVRGSISRFEGDLEEVGPAIQFFNRLLSKLRERHLDRYEIVLQELRAGVDEHKKYVQSNAEALGNDWLITPDIPLDVRDFKPRSANIGRELMASILEVQSKKRRLMWGLGTAHSQVDVVAIAFPLGTSFGGDGALKLCEKIRRVLQYPEANRIVAVLGFGVYDMAGNDLDGRYVADYLRVEREDNGFDGLVARPNSDTIGEEFGRLLSATALSSDPRRIQIENPDANQLQRDFGKSLVSFGFAESEDAGEDAGGSNVMLLYKEAMKDLTAKHCVSNSPLRDRFKKQVTLLKKSNATWLQPDWTKRLATCDKRELGAIERETARKVIIYIGHPRGKLVGTEVQRLREHLERQFPRARTVIYKYELPSSGGARAAARKKGPGVAGALRRFFFHGEPEGGTNGSTLIEPDAELSLKTHLAVFLVDCFESAAVERFRRYLLANAAVRNEKKVCGGNGDAAVEKETLYPGDAKNKIGNRIKDQILTRSVISMPAVAGQDIDGTGRWEPEFEPGDRSVHRSCARNSILSDRDDEFMARLCDRVEYLLAPGEVGGDDSAKLLLNEASATAYTVRKVPVYLVSEADKARKNAAWFSSVMAGLNWLCNEQVQRRKVVKPLHMCIRDIELGRQNR